MFNQLMGICLAIAISFSAAGAAAQSVVPEEPGPFLTLEGGPLFGLESDGGDLPETSDPALLGDGYSGEVGAGYRFPNGWDVRLSVSGGRIGQSRTRVRQNQDLGAD